MAARIATVTPEHLCRLFRVHVGARFTDWQHAVRIEQGKRLIVEKSLPLKRVHSLVGYAHYETFSRVFKRCEGKTAKQLQRFVFDYPELAAVVCSHRAEPVFRIAPLVETDPATLRLLHNLAGLLLRYQLATRRR